jgi:opacity protein-like surface antigen
MKKFTILCLAMAFGITINAQLKKGQWMLGGELDFSSTNFEIDQAMVHEDRKFSEFQFSPGIGFFFADKFAGGLRLTIGTSKMDNMLEGVFLTGQQIINRSELKNTQIGISPFIRYYFLPTASKLNIFADGSYTYSSNRISTETFLYEGPVGGTSGAQETFTRNKSTSSAFTLSAGPAIFINRNVSIELSISYTHENAKSSSFSDSKTSRFLFGTGFQIHFGR